jgi:argininosuccinate lyase
MTIGVFTQVLRSLTVNAKNIEKHLDPLLLATDCADYLVRKGVAFRQAHKAVGKIVAYCIENRKSFSELPLSTFASFHPLFGKDIRSIFSWSHALAQREIEGGTGKRSVLRQIACAKKMLERAK